METKTLKAVVVTKSAEDGGPGTFEAILSMPTVDRDKEVVVAKALEPLPARITIDIDHGLSVAKTVGSGVPYYDGDVLKISGTFASTPLGQEVRTLVNEGHVDGMSVVMAFTEKEHKDGVGYITKGELINATFTGIPSNREARVLTSKIGARNSAKDADHIQGIYNAAVALGAICPMCAEKSFSVTSFGENPTTYTVDIKSADTESPADTAATAAVSAGAEVDVARVLAELALIEADLT